MKNILIISALLFSFGLAAQEDSKEPVKDKKIEVIKIIDGDTVMHSVREIKSTDLDQKHGKMRHHSAMREEMQSLDDEIESMIEDLDIYICADGMHKKMILHHMENDDGKLEDLMKSLDIDEDILIDFEDGRKKMKVMKIKISDDDLEEIETIEMGPRRKDIHIENSDGHMNKKQHSSAIKVFPNPAKDNVNIEFEVMKGKAELSVTDMDGVVVFAKTYNEAGLYRENVKLNSKKSKMLIVELKEERRLETRKIIVD